MCRIVAGNTRAVLYVDLHKRLQILLELIYIINTFSIIIVVYSWQSSRCHVEPLFIKALTAILQSLRTEAWRNNSLPLPIPFLYYYYAKFFLFVHPILIYVRL